MEQRPRGPTMAFRNANKKLGKQWQKRNGYTGRKKK